MRLTTSIKKQIVNNIVADIAKRDFDSEVEKIIRDEAYKQLPGDLKKIYDDPKLREYLSWTYFHPCRGLSGVKIHNCLLDENKIRKKIAPLERAFREKQEKIKHIKNSIYGTLEKISTVKKARELMPEFEKYMPEEERQIFYPIAKNISEELKALGWPAKETK